MQFGGKNEKIQNYCRCACRDNDLRLFGKIGEQLRSHLHRYRKQLRKFIGRFFIKFFGKFIGQHEFFIKFNERCELVNKLVRQRKLLQFVNKHRE